MKKKQTPDLPVFRQIARRKAYRANPFGYEASRTIVVLRLLGFNVRAIWAITGIKPEYIKVTLKEHGTMPRRSDGAFFWSKGYEVPGWRRKFLELPPYCPRRVEYAYSFANAAHEKGMPLDRAWDFELPKIEGAPENGCRTDWTPESRRADRHRLWR